MKLTTKEAAAITWEDHDDWKALYDTKDESDGGRWCLSCSMVCLHKPTGKHYMFWWSEGKTEQQCHSRYEYDGDKDGNVDVYEVELKETVVKAWVKV